MYYSLVILLHRPFVSDGDLNSISSLTAREAFSHCTVAAVKIHEVLEVYRKSSLCLKTVPYFISYATYVSGTIHARIAAQTGMESQAGKHLRNCLIILTSQQTKCRAPRKTLKILKNLMSQLGIEAENFPSGDCTDLLQGDPRRGISDEGNEIRPVSESSEQLGENNITLQQFQVPTDNLDGNDCLLPDLRMDDILKSFDFTSGNPQSTSLVPGNSISSATASMNTFCNQEMLFPDVLFGFDYGLTPEFQS